MTIEDAERAQSLLKHKDHLNQFLETAKRYPNLDNPGVISVGVNNHRFSIVHFEAKEPYTNIYNKLIDVVEEEKKVLEAKLQAL